MSEVTFNSLLFCIVDRLEEINALKEDRVRKYMLFLCKTPKTECRDDETILSLLNKLKESGFLGVDSLQMLKDILEAEGQWDVRAEIDRFEATRREYKKLLQKIIDALEKLNDLEKLTSFVWERWNVPEERRNDVRDVRSLVQVLEEMNVIGVDCLNLFRELFIELINNDELLTELREFQNRRTKDEKSGRRKAQAAAVWSYAGAVSQKTVGVLKAHCTLKNFATGCSLAFGVGELLRRSSTLQDFVDNFRQQILPEGTRLLGLSEESVCFMVQGETSLALVELYERYSTGRLQKDLQKFLVTDDIRQLADGEEVVVLVHIDEKEFREACDDLINVDKEDGVSSKQKDGLSEQMDILSIKMDLVSEKVDKFLLSSEGKVAPAVEQGILIQGLPVPQHSGNYLMRSMEDSQQKIATTVYRAGTRNGPSFDLYENITEACLVTNPKLYFPLGQDLSELCKKRLEGIFLWEADVSTLGEGFTYQKLHDGVIKVEPKDSRNSKCTSKEIEKLLKSLKWQETTVLPCSGGLSLMDLSPLVQAVIVYMKDHYPTTPKELNFHAELKAASQWYWLEDKRNSTGLKEVPADDCRLKIAVRETLKTWEKEKEDLEAKPQRTDDSDEELSDAIEAIEILKNYLGEGKKDANPFLSEEEENSGIFNV